MKRSDNFKPVIQKRSHDKFAFSSILNTQLLFIRSENRQLSLCTIIQGENKRKCCRISGFDQIHERRIRILFSAVFF